MTMAGYIIIGLVLVGIFAYCMLKKHNKKK